MYYNFRYCACVPLGTIWYKNTLDPQRLHRPDMHREDLEGTNLLKDSPCTLFRPMILRNYTSHYLGSGSGILSKLAMFLKFQIHT